MDAARRTVSDATTGMSRAADAAKAALAGIGAGIGLAQIIQMSDAYAKFTAQLRLASTSAREYAAAYGDVKRIATTSQQGLQETGVLYARIANGTRELGTSQKQVAAITETVNMALKVSGATTQESASAQLQLSQAFASGTLRGEEFNAVNEAAPRLMLALADGIGVPVGALKKMASEGEITSQIMADVLPKALSQLREEAKQVETIGGAFTVLKNNLMEFVGIQSQANGTVAVLTGAIGLLANNLGLLMGLMTTMAAAKVGTWAASWITSTYGQVAASSALRAAIIASAEAELASIGGKIALLGATQAMIIVAREEAVAKLRSSQANIASATTAIAAATAAGAQSFALRTLQLATAELAVAEARRAAMIAELAVLGQQQARVSAQVTAALAAQTAAQASLTAATGAGGVAAGLGARAIGFLGGPIGAIITLLGIGATAWAVWGNKGSEAEKKVADTLADEIDGYLANLNRQIDKLKERNELAGKGMTTTANPVTDSDKKREQIMAEINSTAKRTDIDITIRTELLKQWGGRLNQLTVDTEAFAKAQQKNKDLVFDKKEAEWLGKNGTAAQKMAYELKELEKEFGRVTPAMEAWVKAKYADKGAAATIRQEETAYTALVTSIGEKIAANNLELSGFDKLTDAQKMTIKLDEAITSGKNKLTAKHIEAVRATIAEVAAGDKEILAKKEIVKQAEELAKIQADYAEQHGKALEAAIKEAEANEELVRTFGMTKSAIELLAVARMEERVEQLRGIEMADDEIATLERVIAAKKRSAEAVGKGETLTAAKKANDDLIADGKRMAESIETSLTDALLRGFESGKGFGRNLVDTIKNMFGSLVLRPIISAIVNPVAGAVSGAMGFSGAANAATSGIGSAVGSSLGISGTIGAIGVGAMQTAGAIMAGEIGMGATLSAGMSALGTGTASGMMAGMSSIVGALGPIALGIGAAVAIWKSLDNGNTEHSGGAATASSAGVRAFDSSPIGFHLPERNAAADQMTAALASGIVSILDSTALAFGKTAGYTAATAFADDTSEDGAWGALAISKLGEKVLNWKDTQTSRWAPKEFADGEAGKAQYLAALSQSVRAALNDIGLPDWAKTMLDGVGAGASIEDIAKVADQINKTQAALKMMGNSLVGFSSLSDKAASSLIAASGGIDALAANASAYYDAFYTEAEKSASTVKAISDVLAAAGVAMPANQAAFRATVEAQMKLGEAGAPAVAALFKVAQAFAQVNPVLEATTEVAKSVSDALNERKDLQKQLDQLTLTSAQLRAKERMAIDASNLALFDQITQRQEIAATSDALKTSIDNLKDFRAGILSFRDSLTLGSLSPLTPMQKMIEAQRQYDDMLTKAKSGDSAARSGIQNAATAYLTADQIIKASSAAYVADALKVQADLSELARIADTQMTDAQLQLSALDKQVSEMVTLNETAARIETAMQTQLSTTGVTRVDYAAMGTSNMAPLVEEIKGLRADNAELVGENRNLRKEMFEHVGALIKSVYGAADTNASQVNAGTSKALVNRNYKQILEGEAIDV